MRRLENPSAQSVSPLKSIGVILAVLGVLAGIYAVRVEMKEVTAAEQTGYWPSKRFSRVQISGRGSFTGTRHEDGRVTVERMINGTWKVTEVHSGMAQVSGPVVANPEGTWAAWRRGESLAVWETGSGLAPAAISVDAVEFAFLSGSLVAVTREGNLEWWNPAARVKETAISLSKGASSASISADRVAVVDRSQARLLVYSLGIGRRVSLVEEARPLLAPFKLAIGANSVLFLGDRAVAVWGELLTLPGRAKVVTAGLRGEILATGEFSGVYSLMKGKDPDHILEARTGSVVDTSGYQMVLSGPGGSSLYDIASIWKLSKRGTFLAWLSGASLFIAICLLFGRQLMNLIAWIAKRQSAAEKVRYGREELPEPEPELFAAFSRGEVALWTGSGLGAQAGLPTRAEFIKMLLETAYYEEWADPNDVAKLIVLANDNRREEAVDKLLALLGTRQHLIFEQIRCHYQRAVKPPEVYQSIGKLPFTAVVSGNYDSLIDTADWVSTVPRVNLFGNAAAPEGILYTRSEMKAAMSKFAGASDLLKELFSTRRIVFAGCSIPELHADLLALGIPKVAPGAIMSKHLCVAAAGQQWERKAKELHEWWGIEVQQCAEDYLPAQVRLWFGHLVTAMGLSKREPAAAAATAGK